MHETDLNRVVFYSKEDMSRGHHLLKSDPILRENLNVASLNINDILELYNIKKYLDNEVYLNSWTEDDILNFKQKAEEYGKIIGQFMSIIDDSNFITLYQSLLRGYINSFWEIFNNQSVFKKIKAEKIAIILSSEPYLIRAILSHKKIVTHYNVTLRAFFLEHSHSAEILLSFYEVKNDHTTKDLFLPKSLSILDKEEVISKYLDSENANLNYFELIQNARNKNDFKISDKTRLKAKRRHKTEIDKIFKEKENIPSSNYGVSISFPSNASKIKDGHVDKMIVHYSYSLDFIKANKDAYALFYNFKLLFEYIDLQNRVNLVSKTNQMGTMERIMGVHSKNDYSCGFAFNLSEMTSLAQITGYAQIIIDFGNSLENILQLVFTSILHQEYGFANNSRFSIPSPSVSFLEKVRILAPEFESILKQYKLFVEEGEIDFELLQISSVPTAIKDIPSLVQNKYIYINEENTDIAGFLNLFFSDQALLAYVEPFKEKSYHTFFNLLANENVNFNNYEDHQKPKINYLIEKGLITLDNHNNIHFTNMNRVIILKDLYENEVASFYHYPSEFKEEVIKMQNEGLIVFDSSLFSKPEQNYFNYFLNKSEFTNGKELRNSYLHGTQANPEEIKTHEYAYFSYLKLLILVMLKIEDDLNLSQLEKE